MGYFLTYKKMYSLDITIVFVLTGAWDFVADYCKHNASALCIHWQCSDIACDITELPHSVEAV